jgi:hypothetical protein
LAVGNFPENITILWKGFQMELITGPERDLALDIPRESIGDNVHLTARMVISAIPGVGGPLLELFNRLLAPPIQWRRDAWLNWIAERLERLERRGSLKIEDLCGHDKFVSTIMEASVIAVKNHQQEKIEALRNAVINVALDQSIDDSKRELFLAFIDDFTVWHLRVLRQIHERDKARRPEMKIETHVSGMSELAQVLLPELRKEPALAEVIADDLCRKGLLFSNREAGVTYLKPGTTQVSELGREFLRFIAEPAQAGPS